MVKDSYIVPISELKRIYDIACPHWKTKIAVMVDGKNPLVDSTVDIPIVTIVDMLMASSPDQRGVVESVFREYLRDLEVEKNPFIVTKGDDIRTEVLNFSEKLFGDKYLLQLAAFSAEAARRPDLVERAFVVREGYSVQLHRVKKGGTLIEIKKE